MRVPPFRDLIERSLIFCVREQNMCLLRFFRQCEACRFSLPCSGRIVRSTGIRRICKSEPEVKKKVSAHSYFLYLPDFRMLTGGAVLARAAGDAAAVFPGCKPCGLLCAATVSSRTPSNLPRDTAPRIPILSSRYMPPLPSLRHSSIVNSQAHQNSSGCASGGQATHRVLIRGSTADAKWLYSSTPVVLHG